MNTEKAKSSCEELRVLERVSLSLSPACTLLVFLTYHPNCKEVGGAWLVMQAGATCYKEATAGDTVEEALWCFTVSFCEV